MAQHYNNSKANIKKQYWKKRLSETIIFFVNLGSWVFSLKPFTRQPYIYEIYTFCWIFWLLGAICYTLAYDISGYTVGGIISLLLFVSQIISHLIMLFDSLTLKRSTKKLKGKLFKIDLHLSKDLEMKMESNECDTTLPMLIASITTIATFCHIIISWTVYKNSLISNVMYWYMLPGSLALQFKMLDFLTVITDLNVRIVLMRRTLNAMGEQNLQRVFEPITKEQKKLNYVLVMPRQIDENGEKDLALLKSIYSEIYSVYSLINECYGWSLLAFTLSYFVYLLCNSYGVILALITQVQDYYLLLQNGGFLLITIVFLWVLLLNCQKNYDQSRYIGCIMFKLVKPNGSKCYNDLVTDFSLQTLHQNFVITAKEFFNLDLSLLGSMIAAIVTYLVYLIQIMFTEKIKT